MAPVVQRADKSYPADKLGAGGACTIYNATASRLISNRGTRYANVSFDEVVLFLSSDPSSIDLKIALHSVLTVVMENFFFFTESTFLCHFLSFNLVCKS